MCVNYVTVSRQLAFEYFRTSMEESDDWREELYQDYTGPIIVHDDAGCRKGLVGTYGFIPKRHMPPGQRLTTMNARAETVGQLRTYKTAWAKSQLCLVLMVDFFEPNWEKGLHERWAIELAGAEPIGLPGMWRTWEEKDGTITNSFTHFTLNADDHPLLKRFHRPGEEKRGVAILRPEHYDDWLSSTNPEFARILIELRPEAELRAFTAPKQSLDDDDVEDPEGPSVEPQSVAQASLF